MAYYISLFSPETYYAFSQSDRKVSGFRDNRINIAAEVKPGDKLICYMTKLSRWVGVLVITSSYFIDDMPLFTKPIDPFIVRFKVDTNVWLAPEHSLPICQNICWDHLSFTKDLPKKSLAWTGMIRGSLRKLDIKDGEYLETLLKSQEHDLRIYKLNDADVKNLRLPIVNLDGRQVIVSVPDNKNGVEGTKRQIQSEQRESIRVQAMLAEIGEKMNLKVWLPKGDRQKILEVWKPKSCSVLLDRLPLNYDDVTLRTIENIDVLWIRKHSIIRAFEVEHTTSIYSGILRMADLMALQPNLAIKAHIVAPIERRSKVLQEISRPVFALLEKGPLSEYCTYIPYDNIECLLNDKNLQYMNDMVLDRYAEYVEDAEI
ncbi:MAG: hypothetical protein ACLVML_03050 [Candidatus Gastranaerophilaceae bacterium]|nr:hypothetical protein [Christensenellales bacterium]